MNDFGKLPPDGVSPGVNAAIATAFSTARSTSRTLIRLGCAHFLLLAVAVSTLCLCTRPSHRALAASLGPAPALALAALLLSTTALGVTLLLVAARARSIPTAGSGGDAGAARTLPVVRVAGVPQGLLLLLGAALTGLAAWHGWTVPVSTGGAMSGPGGLAGAVMLLLAAFPLLVTERVAAAMTPAQLPEAANLAAVLRLPVAACLLLAALAGTASAGLPLAHVAARVLALLLLAASAEMALRTFAIWFAPPPLPLEARARIGSLLALALRPDRLSATTVARAMRAQFGIDFGRSWALAFVREAALPVLVGLLCAAWLLSGVVRVGLDQRAVYERFGAPGSVLGPGLHLLLPWPFGNARITEFGVVHAVAISDQALPIGPAEISTAEGTPPPSANRLWDSSNADISYLVAREREGRQSFETVSVDLRVLYRIGLSPTAAKSALYRIDDPAALLLALSRRLVAHFFAAETLAGVMDERREQIAGTLGDALQRQLDAVGSGIVVTGLIVDSLHPPVGAASAYRQVQAAEVAARTAVAEERGRANGILSQAQRDAHDTLDRAAAVSAEIVEAAKADDRRMDGDVRAWHAGGPAFLLERRLGDLQSALSGATLEIVDSRLSGGAVDLRPPSMLPDFAAPDATRGPAP